MKQTAHNTMLDEPDDLVRRAKLGDTEAVDAWLRREHAPVFRLCFGFLGNYAEAEDAAQESLIRLMDKLPMWNMKSPFRSWRNSVVANLCHDRMRKMSRQRTENLDSVRGQEDEGLPSPTNKVEAREVKELVMQSLSIMPPREREVFVLRDLEGVATAEVAVTLSITESSVRSILTLARRRLKSHLSRRLKLDGGDIA